MGIEEYEIEEGLEYSMKVDAKGARGEGIGRIGNFVIFVKNAKTRIGNTYKVKVTKLHRTFAYAELRDNKQQFIGNGSLVDLG
jgi:predicted RNA-binding protein with TRAM domain